MFFALGSYILRADRFIFGYDSLRQRSQTIIFLREYFLEHSTSFYASLSALLTDPLMMFRASITGTDQLGESLLSALSWFNWPVSEIAAAMIGSLQPVSIGTIAAYPILMVMIRCCCFFCF